MYGIQGSGTIVSSLLNWNIHSIPKHIRKLNQIQLRHLHTILNIKWSDHITNKEVLRRAGMASVESMLLARQLRWSGHLVRMDDSADNQSRYSMENWWRGFVIEAALNSVARTVWNVISKQLAFQPTPGKTWPRRGPHGVHSPRVGLRQLRMPGQKLQRLGGCGVTRERFIPRTHPSNADTVAAKHLPGLAYTRMRSLANLNFETQPPDSLTR